MAEYIQVFTTTNEKEVAEKISEQLVQKRLAACVQILGPITSQYWWENRITKDTEFLIIAKTRADRYSEVEKAIKEVHNYTVPEILAVPVTAGNPDYLKWLNEELDKL
uniref:Divalent-cation tolerance protein CutA n=1 Tax=candidate division WOR-3 bacterium TaxID=2052148 RepID=A0A7C2K141_UNCW3